MIKKKVNGSMMLEATIALVIISMCVAFSYSHISNLLTKDNAAIKVKSRQAIDQLIKIKDFKNAVHTYQGFIIQETISLYKTSEGIYLIEFEIIDDNNKTIEIIKHLCRIDENS